MIYGKKNVSEQWLKDKHIHRGASLLKSSSHFKYNNSFALSQSVACIEHD